MEQTPGWFDDVIDCGGAWLRPRNQDSATVLQIGGEVDAGNADQLKEYACRFAAVAVALVVDMTAVDFLSVKGLRALTALGEQCHDVGVDWALICSSSVGLLLRVTKTGDALPVTDSVPAALQRITLATIGYGSGG